MRILLISCRFPTDLQTDVQGTFRRFNLFLEAFKAIAQLDILFYVPDTAGISYSPDAIATYEKTLSNHWNTSINLFLCPQYSVPETGTKWQRQFAPIFNFRAQRNFISTSMAHQVEALETCLDRQPDAIFCHRLETTPPILKTQRPLPPIFFDLDDIEHISFARQIRQPPTRWRTKLYYLQIPALWWGERRSIQQAHRTFVCSNLDQQYLTQRWGLNGVVSIPNAVAISEAQPLCPEPTVLFLGGYYYFPNLNAANFLIEQIWPHVRRARPDAKLIIAGPQPENIRSYPHPTVPGVEFTGFVENLEALYARTRIVCCPILSGGGTRVKIIEAAAYGKPIVATPIGAEGLLLRDGEDLLIRSSAQEIAQACLELLSNDSPCQRLGASAHKQATQQYDRDAVIKLIQAHVRTALEKDSTIKTPSFAVS